MVKICSVEQQKSDKNDNIYNVSLAAIMLKIVSIVKLFLVFFPHEHQQEATESSIRK